MEDNITHSNSLASVVITCYNLARLGDIEELLLELQHQTYRNFEIVVVVESSVNLLEKIQDFVKQNAMLNVRIIFSKDVLGLSGARNLGVRQATGDYIAIIDDDAVPTSEWLEQAVNCLNLSSTVIGVTGPAVPLWKDQPLEWLPLELQWIIGATTWWEKKQVCDVRHAWGMNMAFKRKAFNLCGGFSEKHGLKKGEAEGVKRFPHEDVEFSLRVRKVTKKRILYNPSMKVFHKVTSRKMNICFFAQNAYVQGFAKRMLKKLAHDYDELPKGEIALDREYALFRRLAKRTIPNILKELPKKPSVNIKKLLSIEIVIFFLALGYLSPFNMILSNHFKEKPSSVEIAKD
jgi:glucosyl-dolichyl phosphate glucuronosyltransferase